ncbi:LOW QUALITY PROTEIN: hypothetical protein CVT26_008152, partial [Gymnopilus dilepis]
YLPLFLSFELQFEKSYLLYSTHAFHHLPLPVFISAAVDAGVACVIAAVDVQDLSVHHNRSTMLRVLRGFRHRIHASRHAIASLCPLQPGSGARSLRSLRGFRISATEALALDGQDRYVQRQEYPCGVQSSNYTVDMHSSALSGDVSQSMDNAFEIPVSRLQTEKTRASLSAFQTDDFRPARTVKVLKIPCAVRMTELRIYQQGRQDRQGNAANYVLGGCVMNIICGSENVFDPIEFRGKGNKQVFL